MNINRKLVIPFDSEAFLLFKFDMKKSIFVIEWNCLEIEKFELHSLNILTLTSFFGEKSHFLFLQCEIRLKLLVIPDTVVLKMFKINII